MHCCLLANPFPIPPQVCYKLHFVSGKRNPADRRFRGVWFCSNGTTEIIGGLVAYAITHHYNLTDAETAPWRILFLVTSLLTVVSGVVFTWYMPDNQIECSLSESS